MSGKKSIDSANCQESSNISGLCRKALLLQGALPPGKVLSQQGSPTTAVSKG